VLCLVGLRRRSRKMSRFFITQVRSNPIQSSSCRAFLEPQQIFIYAALSGVVSRWETRGK
jgi:hypothetical protein